MIWIWASFFILIFLFPMIWYVSYEVVDTVIIAVTAGYSSYFVTADITLLRNIWRYSPVFAVFGGVFGVILYSLRNYRGGVRY